MSALNWLLILLYLRFSPGEAKIHHLALQDDSRRNIALTSFGYSANGSFDLMLSNFTVPDQITHLADSSDKNADKMGVIGFSLSRGASIANSVHSNPRVCQLQQTDQGFDALFFLVDLPNSRFKVYRSGIGKDIRLCRSHEECEFPVSLPSEAVVTRSAENDTENSPRQKRGLFDTIKRYFSNGDDTKEYIDFIPLIKNDNLYSTNISIRFTEDQRGKYHFIYHNCFNYREQGYSTRVAVGFTVDITERNVVSYLSAGDLPKPHLFLYMSLCFFFIGIIWAHRLCVSDKIDVFRVHYLMTCLVFLKALSLFFHGVNFYFVAKYGHQREIWAVVFYITHLLKGALLFGTIVLIGTGYTFFKNFLTERDRNIFMVVLPLQIIDNIALIILEESEFGNQSYQFWYEIFVFVDLMCCFLVFFPIIWSMHHLSDGAKSDGKAAFNLEKLRLFRQFYLVVIFYIYLTRIIKVLLFYIIPYDLEWLCDAVVEISTFFFFIVVGFKFRPQSRNPYLKLSQDENVNDDGIALTQSNLLDGVINRVKPKEESILIDMESEHDSSSGDDVLTLPHRTSYPDKTLL